MFTLSSKSLERLATVEPDLQRIVKRALLWSAVDFSVIEGIRTIERQRLLFAAGKSQTMHSNHLTGRAVDLAAYVNGGISWDSRFYFDIYSGMQKAADLYDVAIRWGGHFKTFKDYVHFELVSK